MKHWSLAPVPEGPPLAPWLLGSAADHEPCANRHFDFTQVAAAGGVPAVGTRGDDSLKVQAAGGLEQGRAALRQRLDGPKPGEGCPPATMA